MDGAGSEPENRFQSAHQLYLASKKSFRDLDIPPRKLLTHRLASLSSEPSMDMYHLNDSPRVLPEETLFQKFLPYNSGVDDDSDPYACDHFRMFEFKIRKCTRSRSHDWTDCPFAHPGEKARRRCPRRFHYSGTVCADFRRGSCSRGDNCEFSHGVFECWLHPSRYRSEACKDGQNCQRKICFFAHTPGQLRAIAPSEMVASPHKHVNSGQCAYCRVYPCIHLHSKSPTSILDMEKSSSSPPSTPPISPAQLAAGISRFSDKFARLESSGSSCNDSKKEIMTPQGIKELMKSMNGMNMNAIVETPKTNSSASTPSPVASESSRVLPIGRNLGVKNFNEQRFVNESSTSGPDLNWVNDLLT